MAFIDQHELSIIIIIIKEHLAIAKIVSPVTTITYSLFCIRINLFYKMAEAEINILSLS